MGWRKTIPSRRAIAWATFAGLTACVAIPAARGAEGRWESYANARFGYAICYPADLMRPQGEADNGDGQRFLAADGAVLAVYGGNEVLSRSLDEVYRETASRLAGSGGRVTYKALKSNRFVVSGHDGAGRVFYATLRARDGQFATFELTYGKDHAATYDKVAARLNGCFLYRR